MPTPNLAMYPKYVILTDGTGATIRPMTRDDAQRLLDFFVQLSEDDRFYLRDNVVAPGVVEGWAQNINYARVLPLLAEVEGRIVGDATLHRRQGGARRHRAEVRVTVAPGFRQRGLGTALLHELLDYASYDDLEEVTFELVEGAQDEALDAARRAGFVETGRFPNHVRDITGKPHDVILMWTQLGRRHASW
jgi:L-amino acid N-acyltransferase YncA